MWTNTRGQPWLVNALCARGLIRHGGRARPLRNAIPDTLSGVSRGRRRSAATKSPNPSCSAVTPSTTGAAVADRSLSFDPVRSEKAQARSERDRQATGGAADALAVAAGDDRRALGSTYAQQCRSRMPAWYGPVAMFGLQPHVVRSANGFAHQVRWLS